MNHTLTNFTSNPNVVVDTREVVIQTNFNWHSVLTKKKLSQRKKVLVSLRGLFFAIYKPASDELLMYSLRKRKRSKFFIKFNQSRVDCLFFLVFLPLNFNEMFSRAGQNVIAFD